ncbi:zf-HC2 domain-containing protein [Corynebacterium breve]|uniref:Zf-HC2 domain-containing protein n=1 Tax=Corynebacterium breve TaxID=3049799 RepID=A0ABY8VIX4_9CORY|nr:zf-HC2 domain-containing protein [Corynebacterium breve]WIM68573.1 zf-HC2 domain-containing protein [Corynebacterium breve]
MALKKQHHPERRSLRRRLRIEIAAVEHLSPEAVAAFVDGELSERAAHRARVHVVHCKDCREEVHDQRRASEYVRGKNLEACVRAPRGLVDRLANLTQGSVKPGPSAESTPLPEADDVMDKIEMTLRAFKRRG